MGTPAKFRFWFKNSDDTMWYYLNGSTVATSSTPKYFLDDTGTQMISPDDWKSLQVGLARNTKYYGVFTRLGLPAGYTYQAKTICQYVQAIEGCEGIVISGIDSWDYNANQYKELAKGELDFSTFESVDSDSEDHFKANIAERGLPELLKAQENVPQEIPFDSDALTIRHDGVYLNAELNFITAFKLSDKDVTGDYYTPTTEINSNSQITPFIVSPISIGLQSDTDSNNGRPWLIAKYNVDNCAFNFKWVGGIFNDVTNADMEMRFVLLHVSAGAGTPYTFYHSPVITAGTLLGVNFDATVTLNVLKGDKFFLYASPIGSFGAGNTYDIDIEATSRTKITGKFRQPESEIKTFRYFTFLDKLFKKALGPTVSLRSDYLTQDQDYKLNYDNNPKWTTVTSGSAVRQISTAKIKTTINDAYQDMRRWGLGLAIEYNTIRIERLPYFFQKDRVVLRLENIKNFKYYSANDYLGNIIHAGYNEQVYDDINGREDIHGKSIFNFPIRRVKKDINWDSSYHASPFAIEFARSYIFDNKESKDSQYDDEVYLIEVNGDPATYTNGRPNLYRPTGQKYGLLNPDSFFNWGLTPYNTFNFNRELLLAMAYGKPLASGNLEFKSSSKNAAAARQLNSIVVDEDATVSLKHFMRRPTGTPATPTGGLVTPLFQPVMFEYDAFITEAAFEILNSNVENRYGVIEFVHPKSGKLMYNFIDDIAILPATDDLYTVRGLSSPDNDLLNLVSKW